jgi:hypothetical protein
MSDDIVDGVPVDQISTEPGATTVLEDFFEEPEDYFVPDAAPTFHLYTRSIKAVQGTNKPAVFRAILLIRFCASPCRCVSSYQRSPPGMPQEIKLNLIGNHPVRSFAPWYGGNSDWEGTNGIHRSSGDI